MSLHLEDPLIGDFEVLPPLRVKLQHCLLADMAFGAIQPGYSASAVTPHSLSNANLSHHDNTLL